MVYMNKKFSISLLSLCIGLSSAISFSADARDITIYYTNDLHAHVTPEIIPYVSKTRPVGGFAPISKIVKDAKAKEKDVFFFDAGDYFTGPFISTLTKGEAIIDILNTMPYDAVSVGNHEFDHGHENLVKQLSKLQFPVLLDNVFYSGTDTPLIKEPYTIVEKDGFKIGVIGMHGVSAFYEAIAAGVREGVDCRDPIPYVKKQLEELKGKVDLTVLLAHEGVPGMQSSAGEADVARALKTDVDMAKSLEGYGLNVLITGHAHKGTPEPIKVGDTLVVSTDAYTIELGKLVLDWNPETKKVDSYNGKLITMYADTYKPDPVTQAKIDEWDNKVKKITDEVVAHSPEVLTRSYGESAPTGNLITDALMATVPGADASFYNAGGIRTELPKGNITYGDVLSMYPFTNDVMSMEISGKDLKSIMSHAADLKNGMLHVSKTVQFKYDSTKPLGQRIVEFDIKGKPVVDNKLYTVALDSFIGKGGGGFTFTKGKNIKYIGIQTAPALVNYMKQVNNIQPDHTMRVDDISK
ncbi:bifunctional metallophosphatase/5'-nucleotidase [Salmonella enterica subsp. enterica serovar Welikade]|nr:bifunctional metallophosphatase/5'-nucleotidase [Salmonella enterica subsp. enterica serovar Welikade]